MQNHLMLRVDEQKKLYSFDGKMVVLREIYDKASEKFIEKVNKLEGKYGVSINSDSGDVYLSFHTKEPGKVWDHIKVGWKGDGSGLKVTEVLNDDEYYKKKALDKLSQKEKELLGL